MADTLAPGCDEVQFRFRNDEQVSDPAVTVDAFLGQLKPIARDLARIGEFHDAGIADRPLDGHHHPIRG